MQEFIQEAECTDVLEMVHSKFKCRNPEKGYLVTAADAEFLTRAKERVEAIGRERDAYAGKVKMLEMEWEQNQLEQTKKKVINMAILVAVGLAWILGAVEGLADPVFASVGAGVSIGWAVLSVKWGEKNE